MAESARYLEALYQARFAETSAYRGLLWDVLAPYLARHLPARTEHVLDLGCGYGEWINRLPAAQRHAMDLNPEARGRLASGVVLHEQDCSAPWPLPERSLDAVVTSNFFEHLPHKDALRATLRQVSRALRPGGRLIAMGPNIRYLPGRYWDFLDHHVALTDRSLAEALTQENLRPIHIVPRFMPYTTIGGPRYPLALVRLYLALPVFWPLLGRQFLVVAEKTDTCKSL